MRHRKNTLKLGRTGAHNRALFANLLKSLIQHEKIVTTLSKGKILKSYADRMITLAKSDTLASRRLAVARLQVRYNRLTPKEAREAKGGKTAAYNGDRAVIAKLFGTLGPRFMSRSGGYTRLTRGNQRRGDNAQECVVEYLES